MTATIRAVPPSQLMGYAKAHFASLEVTEVRGSIHRTWLQRITRYYVPAFLLRNASVALRASILFNVEERGLKELEGYFACF
jgi:hypothetical protein